MEREADLCSKFEHQTQRDARIQGKFSNWKLKNISINVCCYSWFSALCKCFRGRDSSVCITHELGTGRPGFDSRYRQEIFLFYIESRPTLGSTQPFIQWVPLAVSPGVKRQLVKLTTYLHLVPKLRIMELKLHSPLAFMVFSAKLYN
jgi:hypothetical protein